MSPSIRDSKPQTGPSADSREQVQPLSRDVRVLELNDTSTPISFKTHLRHIPRLLYRHLQRESHLAPSLALPLSLALSLSLSLGPVFSDQHTHTQQQAVLDACTASTRNLRSPQ